MDLKTWIDKNGLKKKYVAEQIGIIRVSLRRIINKEVVPRPRTVIAIEKFTKGEVTRKDLWGWRENHDGNLYEGIRWEDDAN